MLNKIRINGEIELLTGLHIGTGGEFAAIGAADSPVIKDIITNESIIPGSSLKGKLRSMLGARYSIKNANGADDDCDEIKRLFGSVDKPSRLIFSDMTISNKDELNSLNVYTTTETKFENTINRLSGVANPRQIERTIRGCKYSMDIIYNLKEEDEALEDMKMLAEGFKLLEFDYLGGHGSRGYGKVKFNNLSAECVIGNVSEDLLGEINDALKG
ncbi:cRISPR-associated RAMP protein Csm3 family [Eubacterium sp. CAG:274]|nr:type III-A CRISPR-associated RAMP protein Csm3 [Clostridia bacterium]CDC18596.1 cRISPR-associated RAMP protein Csm3 family [Eubacterium sp. CAG:274]